MSDEKRSTESTEHPGRLMPTGRAGGDEQDAGHCPVSALPPAALPEPATVNPLRWYRVEFETEAHRGSCSLRATDPMDAAVRFRAENPWLATAYVCAEEFESVSAYCDCGGRLFYDDVEGTAHCYDCGSHERYMPKPPERTTPIDWRAEIALQRRKDRRVLWSSIALALILVGLVLWAFSASAQVRCTTIGRYWTCSDYGSSSQTVRCTWIGRTYVCN